MASKETDDQQAFVFFGDEFLADEILARLPARCAARCTLLSKRFRQLLTSPHFWLRHRRLGAPPPELPQVARIYRHGYGVAFEFHCVSPAFSMKHTVVGVNEYGYAGTCNGLVLVSGVSHGCKGQYSIEAVVFNPATREETSLSLPLPLPHPQNKDVERDILGFGYGPSSKVYKALICEVDIQGTRLMVVSLDGGGDDQEPRTVFSSDYDVFCRSRLHTRDGKVYFLIYAMHYSGEEGREFEVCETTSSVLAFDVDNEVVTDIAHPEGHEINELNMLEVHGRPCIFEQEDHDTLLWLLTPDHRWEQLYILVNECSHPQDYFTGAWDCGGGLLLAMFTLSGAHLYNLNEPTVEDKESGGGNRLVSLSSHSIEYKWPEQFNDVPSELLDYRPTLVSPSSIGGDVALSSRRPGECVVPKHELDEIFLELTRKRVVGPAMQMMANL